MASVTLQLLKKQPGIQAFNPINNRLLREKAKCKHISDTFVDVKTMI